MRQLEEELERVEERLRVQREADAGVRQGVEDLRVEVSPGPQPDPPACVVVSLCWVVCRVAVASCKGELNLPRRWAGPRRLGAHHHRPATACIRYIDACVHLSAVLCCAAPQVEARAEEVAVLEGRLDAVRGHVAGLLGELAAFSAPAPGAAADARLPAAAAEVEAEAKAQEALAA